MVGQLGSGGHPKKRTGGTPNKGQDNLSPLRVIRRVPAAPGDPCRRCVNPRSHAASPPPTPRMQLDSWTPWRFACFGGGLPRRPRLDGRLDDWTPAHLPVAHLLRQRDLARVAHGRRKQSQGAAALPLRDVGVHQRHTPWRPSASRSRWRRSRCVPCVHCGEDRPARRSHRVPRRERDRWRHLPSPWARARLSCRISAP